MEQSVLSPHRGFSVGIWLLGEQDQASSTTGIHQREGHDKPWREVWKYVPSATECSKSSAQVRAAPFAYNQQGENNILPPEKEGALQCSSFLSEFFYLGHGRSTNRKGKICRVKSLGLFLFSFELAFTNISGITPSL